MDYGRFVENGKKYEIMSPLTPGTWNNVLFNDSYYLEVSQTLQGAGYCVTDYVQKKCLNERRYFYLVDRDSGEVWNPNYVPLGKESERYSCVHGMGETKLRSARQGIETTIKVLVPPVGTREFWKISLHNEGACERAISLYSLFDFYDHGVMGGECVYDVDAQVIIKYAVPYHVRYEEYEEAVQEKAYFYVFADRTPTSCDMSQRRFFGQQGEQAVPEGIRNGHLSGIDGEAEEFCGAYSFDFSIAPGETVYLCMEAGAAVTGEEILARKAQFDRDYVEQVTQETEQYWEEMLDGFFMETPDENLNAFGNYWLKKQITLLTRQNRGGTYCPVRNQLQDALGYAMIWPQRAEKYFFDVMKLQNRNGFIQQWYDTSGAPPQKLCLLRHTDGPVWLVICTEALIRQSGRRELLYKKIPYADGGEGNVLEHMKLAILYLMDNLGGHGLCLMGDGDWNDPINGAGREGRGESVWLSMAFVYAAGLILPYLEAHYKETKEDEDRKVCEQIIQAAEHMVNAINTYAWCGEWYAAAIHDDGGLLGDAQDRLFLNTQSWAVISGVADEGKTEKLLKAVKEKLSTPFGPLLLYPPFEAWDARWGRISVKKSGTTENGSVYCHASMFYAYAEAVLRDGDGLYDTLWRTLPTNPENPPEKNLQCPTYLPNYYFGLRDSANFGRSSRHYGTGTVAWMLMLIIEKLLGLKAGVDGLKIQPCLPTDWPEVNCVKKYRRAVYHIHIDRGDKSGIIVDGMPCKGEWLPYEDGREYQVQVTIEKDKGGH